MVLSLGVVLDFPSSASAVVGVSTDLKLNCSLVDFDSTGLTLLYEWRVAGAAAALQRLPMSQLTIFGTFRVESATEYECLVYESGTPQLLLASNSASLGATSKE